MDNDRELVLLDFFEQYKNFFEGVLRTEEEKFSAILKDDINKIQSCISTKQAEVMKINEIENKRMEIQSECGFSDMSFSQIISNCKQQYKEDFQKHFDYISYLIKEIKFFNDKSNNLLSVKLETSANVNDALDTGVSYTKDKKTVTKNNVSIFDKNI